MIYYLLKFVNSSGAELRVILNEHEYNDFRMYGDEIYYLEYHDGTNDTFQLSKHRVLSALGIVRYFRRTDIGFRNIIRTHIERKRGYEKGSVMDLLTRLNRHSLS